jgi:MFS transporter, ACS family, tartrate transporter
MIDEPKAGDGALANRTMMKVTVRLMPVAMALYFVAYIDRSNLGFAGLTMNRDLGFSPSVFGLGGAFFFLGYFALQLPGNLALDRWGARRIVAAISFLWGLCAAGMALVHGEKSFYSARLLLGAAEAALFPGMILYIGMWFPAAWRGRIIALFMLASPLSNVLGLPLSAVVMHLDGDLGLRGWQWLFIVEGLPAILLSVLALSRLTDRPADATWLTLEERTWLVRSMEVESKNRPVGRGNDGASGGLRDALSVRTLLLALGYFGIMTGLYGYGLWLPQIVKVFGFGLTQTGFVAAIPYAAAAVFMTYWGRRLDSSGDRGWHAATACLLGAFGLFAASMLHSPMLALGALVLAAMGLHAAMPTFWTIPTALFKGTAAAAGIALISALGMLGGFVGPYFVGLMREATGNFAFALGCLGIPLLVSAGIAWCFRSSGIAAQESPGRFGHGSVPAPVSGDCREK